MTILSSSMKATRVAEAVLRLRNTPEFAELRDWLAQEQQTALLALRRGEGAALHRAQGAYDLVERFKEMCEGASDLLDKARRAQVPPQLM